MPSEKEHGALRDMLRHIDLAEQFAHGHSYESLRDDLQALYAVMLLEDLPPLRASVDQELKRG